jgi:hypothetical protein
MLRVYKTPILDAPPDSAWATLRDFMRIAEWHEAVTRVEHIDNGPGDRVGCVRRMEVDGGAIMTERLVALSDRDRCYSYELVDSLVPVRNFVGTVQVVPITRTGQSMLSWTATFDAIEGDVGDPGSSVYLPVLLRHASLLVVPVASSEPAAMVPVTMSSWVPAGHVLVSVSSPGWPGPPTGVTVMLMI